MKKENCDYCSHTLDNGKCRNIYCSDYQPKMIGKSRKYNEKSHSTIKGK